MPYIYTAFILVLTFALCWNLSTSWIIPSPIFSPLKKLADLLPIEVTFASTGI